MESLTSSLNGISSSCKKGGEEQGLGFKIHCVQV
jgi:hypothetical protein